MKRRICAVIMSIAVLFGTVLPLAGFEEALGCREYGTVEQIPEDGSLTNVFTAGEGEIPEEAFVPGNSEICELEMHNGGMTIAELQGQPQEIATAAVEYNEPGSALFSLMKPSAQSWYFDVYYVNQEDDRRVFKTQDFSLKYQFEFHTDMDLNAGSVLLRFPLALCSDRYGTDIVPSDIGVPMGRPDSFTELVNSPFNYYIENGELVFFNYRKIPAGTNAAVQVLYKNLKILDMTDQTGWQLQPQAFVNNGNSTEVSEPVPLVGSIDSQAELAAVSKTALKEDYCTYTPGIYTPEQMKKYIGEIPVKYQDHFSDFAYVLWKVRATGHATQAWELYLKEMPAYTYNGTAGMGEIAGINVRILDRGNHLLKEFPAVPVIEGVYTGYYKTADYLSDFKGRDDIRIEFYIIAAYPKEAVVTNQTVFSNTAELVLHPQDGIDQDNVLNAEAQWTWADYAWTYKGNLIGVKKSTSRDNYSGWMNLYCQSAEGGYAPEDLSFHVKSESRGYGFTHHIDGPACGAYKEGTCYEVMTADDVVYAYPLSGAAAGEKYLLSWEDYYFSEIEIAQKDIGYDVFSDQPAQPEPVENTKGIDRGLTVYAMFKGNTQWEKVDYVPWDSAGSMTYVFSEQMLSRQPWRVKAVHNSADYASYCDIKLKLRIRPDSPVLTSLIRNNDENLVVRLENLAAVTGRASGPDIPDGVYFHDQNTTGTVYQEKGLEALTQGLYGTIAMRDCRLVTLSPLVKQAGAVKYAKAGNNPARERVDLQYTVCAWEGYELFSESILPELRQNGLPMPSRKEAVFYDLLPLGVKFDPSKRIIAGRLAGTSEARLRNPVFWNEQGVTVSMDTKTDVIPDFRGTGRTLLKFHVRYDGADPALYYSGLYAAGFGVSFHGYCSWQDVDTVQKAPNICAYMPETGDLTPVLGAAGEVSCDDGQLASFVNTQDYKYFGADINEDGITNIPNVLYCKAMAFEDIAAALRSGIEKTVRADEDRFGVFKKSATVGRNGLYTYEINVTNIGQSPLKNIVVFDRLENAAVDRRDKEKGMVFDTAWWHGELKAVETAVLKELGVSPVIFYHGNRKEAPVPNETTAPGVVLTESNGWYEASKWPGKLSDVGAVAVDLSRRSDGTEFKLGNMESASFQLKLQAPQDTVGAVHAYNNASFFSISEGTDASESILQTVEGNSTRVEIEGSTTMELVKEVVGEVPDHAKKEAFLFQVFFQESQDSKMPYASREYSCYFKENGEWIKKQGIYATDALGRLSLSSGEKAVFVEQAGASRLSVVEEDSPFWDKIINEEFIEGVRRITCTNRYRPVLYLEKKVKGVPENADVSGDVFRFQITCNGKAAANREFWYVDQMASYGTSLRKLGSGVTDGEGVLSIRVGEIIALFPGNLKDTYTVTELPESYGGATSWLPVRQTEEGILSSTGNRAVLENSYRWKELYINKKLTHQKPEGCTAEFSFQIWELSDSTGSEPQQLVTEKSWELLNEEMRPLNPPVKGTIGADGIIKCACAGKYIRVDRLEAGKTYRVQEVNVPELYVPVNHGITEVTMPVHASGVKTELVNEYQMRDIRISKVVIPAKATGGTGGAISTGKRFLVKLQLKEAEGFVPKAHAAYRVEQNGIPVRTGQTDKDGIFEISNSETAIFDSVGKAGQQYRVSETPDAEYPPVYPQKDGFIEGVIEKEGANVTVINGTPGSMVFQKKYVASSQDAFMVEALKNESFLNEKMLECGFTVEIDAGNGWNQQELDLICIHTGTGVIRTVHVGPGQPLIISPVEAVVLQGLAVGTKYRITELAQYAHRVVKDDVYTNSYITISQKYPEKKQGVTGVVGKDFYCSITNELRSFQKGSRIYKAMLSGSLPVADQAELVYRVEEWNGAYWKPAADIRYVVMKETGDEFSGKIEKTDASGLIHIYHSAAGTPSVQFEKDVRPNREKGKMRGELRIVEVPELSDKSFGYLAGFSSSELKNSANNVPVYDLQPEDIDTFVNSNTLKAVDIEKRMDGNRNQSFLLRLSSSGENSGQLSADIDFTLFDSVSDKVIGTGRTAKDGSFFLQPGQYARFYLRDGSRWIVTESMPYPCELERIECKGENTAVLGNNEAVISLQNTIYGRLTKEMVELGVFDPVTEERINLTSGDLVIPTRVLYQGKTVNIIGIGSGAFLGCTDLKSVTIPEHIRAIGSSAFQECCNLRRVILPAQLQRIESYTFAGCTGLTDICIPEGLREIGANAFDGCRSLISIQIPSTIRSLNPYVFRDCVNLTQITLPSALTAIKQGVFWGCHSLNAINIPTGVTEIQSSAFYGCGSLSKMILPDTVTILGANSFMDCRSLSEVVLSNNLSSINNNTFTGCSSLTDIIIPDKVTSVGSRAFHNCIRLGNIKLPLNLNSLGSQAFQNCSALKRMVLTGRLSSIGVRVFCGCSGLEEIIIPDSVTSIEYCAFEGCMSLRNIVLPQKLATLGGRAFAETGLKEINIPESVTAINANTFTECNYLACIRIDKDEGTIANAKWGAPANCAIYWRGAGGTTPEKVYDVEDAEYFYSLSNGGTELILEAPKDRNLRTAVIPAEVNGRKVSKIAAFAFAGCGSLVQARVPGTVISIGRFAFSDCTGLIEAVLPDGLNNIEEYTFRNCMQLKQINIPACLVKIGKGAFVNCTSIEEVLLPESLEVISPVSFKGCYGLTRIQIPHKISVIEAETFFDCKNIKEVIFSGNVNRIESSAFENCYNMTSCNLPDSVRVLGIAAFRACRSLRKFAIPQGVKIIPSSVFQDCWSLEEVLLAEAVTTIKSNAFGNCRSLRTISFPRSVTSIESYVFDGCVMLDQIHFPEQVTVISDYVLRNCKNLKKVTFGSRVLSIKRGVLDGCCSLKEITIPSGVQQIGGDAFRNCSSLTKIRVFKAEDSLPGSPWGAPNKILVVKWIPEVIAGGQ